MADVLVLVAHPDIARSRVNRALAAQARLLPSEAVEVRDIYALYPDYVIDIEAEQAALAGARTVVWLHPVQWYSMPALMKLWVDEVLAFRWAYGPGGRALAGKCLWLVVSTGGSETSYQEVGSNRHPFASFVPAYGQTAELVGMRVKEHTIAQERFQEFVAALGIPLITALRDTQNYVHLAAHGLTLFDVAPGKVERDLAQFEPLGRWLVQPAKAVPLE